MMENLQSINDIDAFVIGGDVVYDNGINSCFHSWDQFLDRFQSIFLAQNRLIPLILSVGNHDVIKTVRY